MSSSSGRLNGELQNLCVSFHAGLNVQNLKSFSVGSMLGEPKLADSHQNESDSGPSIVFCLRASMMYGSASLVALSASSLPV